MTSADLRAMLLFYERFTGFFVPEDIIESSLRTFNVVTQACGGGEGGLMGRLLLQVISMPLLPCLQKPPILSVVFY